MAESGSQYFDTEKALTKWSIVIILYVYEKFKKILSFSNWAMKCCTMNTSKPKSSGEERERYLIFSSTYRQPSIAKSHKEKKQHTEKCDWIKKLQETMHTLKYPMFVRKPRYGNCKAFYRLSTSNAHMRQALLQLFYREKH